MLIPNLRKMFFRKLKVNTAHEVTKYALRVGLIDSSELYIIGSIQELEPIILCIVLICTIEEYDLRGLEQVQLFAHLIATFFPFWI